MAKNIKAVKCPHCGSVQKTSIGDHFYRCNSCHTEYFLDDDDINININHNHHNHPSGNLLGNYPAKTKKILIGVVIGIAFTFFMGMIALMNNSSPSTASIIRKEKPEFRYSDNYVYTNTVSGKAVLLRIAREQLVGEDRNHDFVNTYAIFIDPITKAEIERQLLFKNIRRLSSYSTNFRALSNGDIFMTYNDQTYFKVDRANNALEDVTHTLFQNHPGASSGIAKLSMYDKSWDLLTNDGKKFRYIPVSDKLLDERDYKIIQEEEKLAMPLTYFKIVDNDSRLIKVDRSGTELTETNMDPERKYFAAKILVQEPDHLLVQCNTTAAPRSPTHLQRIDVNTGKVLWTTQASAVDHRSASKCKNGYAAFYRSGEEMDYQSGVRIYSHDGRLIHEYKIAKGGDPIL